MQTLSSQGLSRNPLHLELASLSTKAVLWPAQLLISYPVILFLAALAAMLLRHPDVQFYEIDRIAFVVLLAGVVGRAVVMRESVFVFERASWPMIGLTVVALTSVAGQPFDHETWSLLASKFIVPFALFHLAGLVFRNESQLRQFEIFSLVLLGYLAFTAIAFLFGMQSLIFPRFILDETVGFHADRARGPLLQAVANGVSLNILGLLAFHAYRRENAWRLRVAVLLASVPLAILATMTRAVWLSFTGTIIALMLLSDSKRARKAYVGIFALTVGGLSLALSSDQLGCTLSDRLKERGPIEYRQAVYAGAWEMFLQRPWTGWGFHQMPGELPHHVIGYRDENLLYPHNTYLELLAENGVVGLGLYAWLMGELWRLRRSVAGESGFLDENFHRIWPVILAVYWVNAAVVVMSYQFVNALLFTMAGMLAAQHRRARMAATC